MLHMWVDKKIILLGPCYMFHVEVPCGEHTSCDILLEGGEVVIMYYK